MKPHARSAVSLALSAAAFIGAAAGTAVANLKAELDYPALISDWFAFNPEDAARVFSFADGRFAAIATPDWLELALEPADAQVPENVDAAAPAPKPRRPWTESRFSPDWPVVFPQMVPTPPGQRQLALAVKLDMAFVRDSLLPVLADRFFHDYGESGEVRTATFVYQNGFPQEALAADLVFPLNFAPSRPVDLTGTVPDDWRNGDWGMSVRYGATGILGLMTVKRRVNLLLHIPLESCHPFRSNPATCSGNKLPPIPDESCHF